MSSSGLDWQPVIEAWLKTRSEIEQSVFRSLFDNSFLSSYTYATQNLKFSMKVLQCNIIQQVSISKIIFKIVNFFNYIFISFVCFCFLILL